jgi:protein-S-isoprenylcysteine O-methyltransferase Ste14
VTQVVFYVAFTVWLVLTLLIEPVIIRSKGTKTAKTREDKGSGLLIYLSLFVSIIVAFQFAGANIMPLPDWVFIVGICLMMLGIFVREWAVTTLRGFFLFTVGVRQNHKVIENGPYRLVRHPAYSGSILTMIGLGLATQSAVAVLILAVVCGIAYGYRIHVEEPALVKELGGEYVQYMSRTKRLIPFVF